MAEVVARQTRFHVQRLGSGEPTVVFLHGLVMDNLSSWYFTLANPLATRATALMYDLRGHGRSQRTASGYRIEDMVADLAGILMASDLWDRRVSFVGNSFGGLLALAFALAYPRRVDRIALIDAQLNDADWIAKMQRTLQLQGEERDKLIAERFKAWLGRHSTRKRTRLAENAHALVYETSLVEDLGASPSFTDQQLATIRRPVLAPYGEESDMLCHGQRLARTLPDCELRLFPNCTHSILWEATAEVRTQVLQWHLSKNEIPRTRR